MSKRLPPRAHLDHLKTQAKDLLRAQRSGEPAAVQRLRAYLTRLSSDDEDSAPVSLQETQYVIAREYGFANWAELLEEVRSEGHKSVLQAVRQVHNGLLPALHTLFAEALGQEAEVVIVEARQVTFVHFVQSLGSPFWSYRFHINHHEGWEGWANLAFSLPLCAALLKLDAGSEELRLWEEAIPGIPMGETVGHEMWGEYPGVIARFVIALAPEIEKAWETVFEMGMGDINLQTVPSSLDTGRPTDPAIRIEFEINSKGYEELTLSFCYLLSSLEPVLSTLKDQNQA